MITVPYPTDGTMNTDGGQKIGWGALQLRTKQPEAAVKPDPLQHQLATTG